MDSIIETAENFEHLNSKSLAQQELNHHTEALKNQKQHFKSLTDRMSEGLAHCKIICNDNGEPIDYRVLSVNAAYEKHTGIKKEHIVGKRIKEIAPDMEKSWIDFYGEVALTQKTKSTTGYNAKTKRHYHSTAYSDKHGEFMMLFKDITKKVELEKAYDLVTKSTKMNVELLSNMQEGYQRCSVICDENNLPIDYKILEVNEAFEKLVEVKREQVEGKRILEIIPDMDLDPIQRYGNVALTGESNNFLDVCTITGKIFDISAFSPKSGQFALFFRDVTERETTRLNLEEAYQKVEKSEKLKSAFLANMSHEIRTPLNAILGCSELLEEENLTKEDQTQCLNHIKNSGNRLLTIISDILDISKFESEQQELQFQPNCLNELIDGLQAQFDIIKKKSNIRLTSFKSLDNNNSCIKTDAPRLEQIISNLLENAYKYTETGEISFGYHLKDEFLEFFVKDSGIGIAKEDQQIIFERFGQAANQKYKVNTGTGLGIPIAKGFVELFEGKMWLKSEVNQGTTFFFKIPYLPCDLQNKTLEKPKVLVAEDEEVNFYLLKMWLGKYCDLIHASDGNKVLEIFQKEKVDLILMDVKMPYMNGIEATSEIRKSNKNIPIIAQSAFVMQAETEEILAAGCNEVMTKPIKQQTFKQVLKQYLPQLKF